MVMYVCSEHGEVMQRRSHPFPHFACPVPGCQQMKANKWARKIAKRSFMPDAKYIPYCPRCLNTQLVLMPVTAPESPFARVYCPDCANELPIDEVPKRKL